MIEERLALRVVARGAKRLREKLLHDPPLRRLIEALVERQEGPRAEQTIPGELDLAARVHVEDPVLDRRTTRNATRVHVRDLAALARLDETNVVAARQLGQLRDIREIRLLGPLGLGLVVRHDLLEIAHQMPVAAIDAARGEDERALLVAPPRLLF